jgi:serine/threonine protein kinase/Flp pilus assembly protein TadD
MLYIGQSLDLPDLAQALGSEGATFAVTEVLQGGMGLCAKVVQRSTGRPIALKLIQPAFIFETIPFSRYLQEIKIWTTASQCDAVIEVLSVFRFNEIPCVCAPWMAGGDLRQQLERCDCMFFFRTMDRVLAALEWVYISYGIVHRDLKPANILLDENGHAFVGDWGLGRLKARQELSETGEPKRRDVALTGTGQAIGTVGYSAPEQILGIKEIDHRTDIYSIGCVMYQWEAGHLPFVGRTWEEIAYQHVKRPIARLGGFLKRSKFGIASIVERCLEKNRENRFETYAALRTELRQVARKRGVGYEPHQVKARYVLPLVGSQEIRSRGFKGEIAGSKGYGVVSMENVQPFLTEAELLLELNDHKKAQDILQRLYIPELMSKFPDEPYHQRIAVDYGLCLTRMGRASEAITVLRTIEEAKTKPNPYFLNLTLALIQSSRDIEAERVAKEGLTVYPNDPDLLGNLTLALTGQKRHAEAEGIALRRLKIGRNVHSLEEVAIVQMAIAKALIYSDWPQAAERLHSAIRSLDEARTLNPRYLSARMNLAKAYFHREDFDNALREAGEVAKLAADSQTVVFCATIQAESLNRLAAARDCVDFCDKWLDNAATAIPLQRVRAETIVDFYCIGKVRDGVRVVEESSLGFFSLKQSASDVRYLARLKHWMGDVSEAYRLLDEAEGLEPGCWEVAFNRAAFSLADSRLDQALYHAQRTCSLAPWSVQAWNLISAIHEARGAQDEATQCRQRAENVKAARLQLRKGASA